MNKAPIKDILRTSEKLNRDWLLDDTEASLTILSGEITVLQLHRSGLYLFSKELKFLGVKVMALVVFFKILQHRGT